MRDHAGRRAGGAAATGRAVGAWQRATARASAASPGSPSPARPRGGDHEGDLALLGAAEAGDLAFTVAGEKAMHGQARLRAGQEHDAAHVAEDEGGAGVGGVEEVLDGEARRGGGGR